MEAQVATDIQESKK